MLVLLGILFQDMTGYPLLEYDHGEGWQTFQNLAKEIKKEETLENVNVEENDEIAKRMLANFSNPT